jgi:E3 ubiquitin-protein ligase NRDP1
MEILAQAPVCEHAFCRGCIGEWLGQQSSCPVDRRVVAVTALEPVPRILRNHLGRLNIKCVNEVHGCNEVRPVFGNERIDTLDHRTEDIFWRENGPVRYA